MTTPKPTNPNVVINRYDGYVIVFGDTYHVRKQLADLGGFWDPVVKNWYVPADSIAEAHALTNPIGR